MNKNSFLELGLTNETLYDVNMAMPYWSQLGPQEFLMAVAHDMREQAIRIKYFLDIIVRDKNLVDQPLEFFVNKKTTKEIYDYLIEFNNRSQQILDVVGRYAIEMENTQ